MLSAFRRLGDTWFIKVFLMFLALTFVAWGIGGYLTGGSYGDAITIGDTHISLQKIDRDYTSQRQIIERNTGMPVNSEQLLQAGFPTRYLVKLMQETVLLQTADELDLTAPQTALTKLIQNNPLFHNSTGFDVATYKRNLRTIGYTTAGYEAEQRRQLTIELLAQAFMPPQLPVEVLKPTLQRARQTMDVTTLKLTAASLPQLPKPTDEQLNAFYQQNTARYMTPTERDLSVLTLDPAKLSASTTPSDAEIEIYYKEHQSRFTAPEQRTARQILVRTQQEATDLRTQLANGADFATLAKEHSLDKTSAANGGTLGTLTQAETLPVLANTLFSLKENDISQPVASPLGYHLLQVTSITQAAPKQLSEVKDQIHAALAEEIGQSRYFDLLEDVEDRLAAGDSLADIAKALNLQVAMYTGFNENRTYDLPDAVQLAAFQQPAGEAGEGISLDNNQTAFVEVADIRPAQLKPLADIRADVTADWTKVQVQQTLLEKARAIAKQRKEASLAQATKAAGVTGTTAEWTNLARTPGADKLTWLNTDARTTLLRQGQTASVVQAVPAEEAVYIVQLKAAHQPVLTEADLKAGQTVTAQQTSNQLIGEFMNTRLSQLSIDYNLPLLQRVFGDGFTEALFPVAKTEQTF